MPSHHLGLSTSSVQYLLKANVSFLLQMFFSEPPNFLVGYVPFALEVYGKIVIL